MIVLKILVSAVPAIPFPRFHFVVDVVLSGTRVRAGRIITPHGVIETPAFIPVATKATIKAVAPEQVASLGAQAILANTFHLYLEPGSEIVAQAGGVGRFMNWLGPTFTDSGGFQVFSLGEAFGKGISKVVLPTEPNFRRLTHLLMDSDTSENSVRSSETLVKIDDNGVTFRSPFDGSEHRFTDERSIEIQRALGADIIFAFDECLSPEAPGDYQRLALDRTHTWAKRSLDCHQEISRAALKRVPQGQPLISQGLEQALFGIVQGGRGRELREESARVIGAMNFDGFGIGGAFAKDDIDFAVGLVTDILPPDRPRHLLGIGAVTDLFAGVEQGIDTFDCVIPTRIARHGTLETANGRINILNARYRADLGSIEAGCQCYTCAHYTRAYLAHLFRAKEMFGATLASIHNLHFFISLVSQMRTAILEDNFDSFRQQFLLRYLSTF